MRNRVFFPQPALDALVRGEHVEVTSKELLIRAVGRRYRIVDAIRVLREVTDGQDVYDIVGEVKSVNFLMELGAELLGSSMLIGDSAYEVVPGFLGTPIGSFEQYCAENRNIDPGISTDEDLLDRYLVPHLV